MSSFYDINFTDEEVKKIEEFKNKHSRYSGAIGGQFILEVIWTSIGEIISLKTDGKECIIRDL